MSWYLESRILAEVAPGSSVLDVGAGMAPYHAALVKRAKPLVLLDAHAPYLEERRQRKELRGIHTFQGDALQTLRHLEDGAFDVVLGIDFLEHLERAAALETSVEMCRVGKKVVLFVPEGEHPQDKDAFHMGGDYWQTHRSAWHEADLRDLGFSVELWPTFHQPTNPSAPGALFCVRAP